MVSEIKNSWNEIHAGGAGGAMAPSDFGRSVNPISTRSGQMPTKCYWHPQIFIPSYGPVNTL